MLKRYFRWIAAAIILVLLALAGAGLYWWHEAPQREIARCNSGQVIGMVEHAFNDSNLAHFQNVYAIGLDTIHETGFSYSEPSRVCAANVEKTDSTKLAVTYTILSRPPDQIVVKLGIPRLSAEPAAPAPAGTNGSKPE